MFGASLDDVWAAFAVPSASYEWLPEEGKRSRMLALMGGFEDPRSGCADRACRRDAGIWAAMSSEWSRAGPRTRTLAHAGLCERARRASARRRHRATRRCFFLVSLREPERDVASYVSRTAEQHPREWLRSIGRALSMRDRRLLTARRAGERARARRPGSRPTRATSWSVRPARGVELQWLVRRAFCRGLGEPLLDGLHEPRALAFERNGEAVLAPLEGDVVRWMDGYVEHRGSRAADGVRAWRELAGAARARRAAGAGDVPGRARGADVRASRKPAVRGGPVVERPLPAQRAGA